jgi:phage gpG-like protein
MAENPVRFDRHAQEFQERIHALGIAWPKKAERMLRWTAHRAKELTIENLKGKVLQKKSGTLASSIRIKLIVQGRSTFRARIWTPVVYAPAHEYGAKIRHPGSTARNKKALHFWWKGEEIFCRSTKPHIINLKPRPFMRPAVVQARREGIDKLKAEWWKGVKRR